MIKSKEDYLYYLNADRIALGIQKESGFSLKRIILNFFLPEHRWEYQKLMREIEYRTNCKKGIINKIILFIIQIKYRRKGFRLLVSIYPNTCGPGLSIAHTGPIRISKGVKIGKNCRIHISTNIGIQAGTSSDSAIIGDNVYIGPGVKFVKPCIIGNSVAIGANSVVTKSFKDGYVSIAGIPAKVVKEEVDTRKILIAATELIDMGVLDTKGESNSKIYEDYFSVKQ
jgi:serine O-acetyltransferase